MGWGNQGAGWEAAMGKHCLEDPNLLSSNVLQSLVMSDEVIHR